MSLATSHIVKWVSTAALWSYAATFLDRIIRFLVFLIVARLVSPPQFGLVVLSLLAVDLLQTFLDAGLSTALIQQSTLSKPALDTAFIITLAVSLLATLVLMSSAPFLTNFTNQRDAVPILRALALVPLINGAGAVHVAIMHRDVRFKTLAVRTAGSGIIASISAVAMAFAGFGAWALVSRTLLSALFGTLIAWLSTSYRPAPHFDLQSIRNVLPAALRLWSASMANQINGKGFDLLAAFFLGTAALGALRIAGQVVMLLVDLTVGPMGAVGYTVLSRSRHDDKMFEEALGVISKLAAVLIFPAFAGLLTTGDLLLPLMFGSRWEPAAGLIPYMSAAGPAIFWSLVVSIALFASGRADRLLQWALLESVLTVTLGFIAGAIWGLVGLAAAGVLRLYVMTPLGWRWLRKDVGVDPLALISAAVPSIVASAIMAAIVVAMRIMLAPHLGLLSLVFSLVATGVVSYVVLLPWSAQPLLRELLQRRNEAIDADRRGIE